MKARLICLITALILLIIPVYVLASEPDGQADEVLAQAREAETFDFDIEEYYDDTSSELYESIARRTLNKNGVSGEVLYFGFDDFASLVSDDDSLEGILIIDLPVVGRLNFDGRSIVIGEAVTSASIEALSYHPVNNNPIETQFTFYPVFTSGVSVQPVTVNISLERKDNRPPTAQDMQLKTFKNIAITEMFKASDPDNDPLTFRVTAKAKRGEFEILPNGSFKYTPYQNKTGNDSITYVAVDSYGNTSEPARIEIKIEKPTTKTTYSDMDGHPAHYAAIRLIEDGIYTGQQLSGSYYFNPEDTVTRGEFIVMVMKSIGIDNLPLVNVTGFADDEITPQWVKPYAQAALKSGIISGVESSDGRKYLRANNSLSLAEAAIMVNNAIGLMDVGGVEDNLDVVPVWAGQAAANMETAGLITASYDLSVPVYRSEAAQMLCKAIDIRQSSSAKENRGLLSWVFAG